MIFVYAAGRSTEKGHYINFEASSDLLSSVAKPRLAHAVDADQLCYSENVSPQEQCRAKVGRRSGVRDLNGGLDERSYRGEFMAELQEWTEIWPSSAVRKGIRICFIILSLPSVPSYSRS